MIILGDCFNVLPGLPSQSVDLILVDPPFNINVSCAWDKEPIDWARLWPELRRIVKPGGPIVIHASEPFTSKLIMSNLKEFKYCWYWVKPTVTGFANAKKQPLRQVEQICVFRGGNYYPQGLTRINKTITNGKSVGGGILRDDIDQSAGKGKLRTAGASYVQEFSGYPKNVLCYPLDKDKLHPTQKPIALLEYLIQTYTKPGELVLDCFAGSCGVEVAAQRTGRESVCIEMSAKYASIGALRISKLPPNTNEANLI